MFSSVQIVSYYCEVTEKSLHNQARVNHCPEHRGAMIEEGGIIARLLERNCQELLQQIFLYLDPGSLHNSRQVCQQWNDFIRGSVWGSQRGRRSLQRRLHHNWLTSEPRVFSVDYTDQMFFHHSKRALALDNKYLVVGLSHVGQGGAKVIDLASEEVVGHLPHQDTQDRGVRCVMMTRSWIITQGRERAHLWSRDNFQLVTTLHLLIDIGSTLLSMETEGGRLYLALHPNPNRLSLFRLRTKPESQEFKLELVLKRGREKSSINQSIKFGTNKDIPVLVTKKGLLDASLSGRAFLIDKFHETDDQVEVKSTNLAFDSNVSDYSFHSPHLAVLHLETSDDPWKLILKVWNIERSPSSPLYSIDIYETDPNFDFITSVTILLENNLIRVSCPFKIFVFDLTTIEDKDSVHKSRREFTMNVVNEDTVVSFNEFLGVSKQQDTITFYNFWK